MLLSKAMAGLLVVIHSDSYQTGYWNAAENTDVSLKYWRTFWFRIYFKLVTMSKMLQNIKNYILPLFY